MYPAVSPQGLYETSTTKKMELGTEMAFRNTDGTLTLARYVKNDAGTTLAAGLVVAWAGAAGEIGGAVATNTPPQLVAGGLAASVADGGYAWVIYRGKQTNASASASTASSAGDRALGWLAGDVAVVAATYASTTAGYANISVCALLKASQALAAAASNTIYWVWR